MNREIDDFLMGLIKELLICSVEELQDVRTEWAAELEREGATKPAIEFSTYLVDLVIEKKQEKARAAG